MRTLSEKEMIELDGGVKWACVGIAVFAVVACSNPISGLLYIGAGVVAGCFD